ncbi:DUF2726 domain-containing protein [Candidatus Albibeggiatoa sp. nov. BB20]|uniref:DUF2726 domain-containing protein n=1 Tax=Candidatus Albibeggiatoa sp. nov. BB20 TaxID=3162723 RepID=UPI0033658C45
MWWIVLGIILCLIVSFLLILNTPFKSRLVAFFSYQNRFKSELPDVELYGGQQKSAIIATEYPHSQLLKIESINIDYQLNLNWPTSDKLPLFVALQVLLPRRYVIFYELNLARFVTTDDAPAFNRLQQYQIDFAIFDIKQKQWIGLIMFKSKKIGLNEKLRLNFVSSILQDVGLPLLLLPKLENYKLSSLKSLINKKFNI